MATPDTSPRLEPAKVPTNESSSTTPSLRCQRCNPQNKRNRKNIVVCIDGTSNKFGQKNTNVVKLFAKIDKESTNPEQLAYYSSGIGTRPKMLNLFKRVKYAISDKLDTAVAWNLEEIVKDAYSWLVQMYQEGDQIYFFGFSRGAYQVRVLAEMIHEVGLIRALTERKIGMAWDHYKAIRSREVQARHLAKEFKKTFSWENLGVHFVGVWDTVSSVGLLREDTCLSMSSSVTHACHFRHALALDERRVKFMPEYFHEMNSRTYGERSNLMATSCLNHHSEIKEVWFAGSHSDVGGKSRPGTPYHAGNVSLLWMRREAVASGLVLKSADVVWIPEDLDFGTTNSMTRLWRALEYIPMKHQVAFSGAGETALRSHRLQARRILPGQKVHVSVLYANAYKPRATLGEGFDIPVIQHGLNDTELDSQIWETGLFDDNIAKELLTYLGSQRRGDDLYRLLSMLRFDEGKRCVRKVPNWEDTFQNLINDHETHKDHSYGQLVRLVAIVAHHEVSCGAEANSGGHTSPSVELPQDTIDDVRKSLEVVAATPTFLNMLILVALLRLLTKHKYLQERILTKDSTVLEDLVQLPNVIVMRPKLTIWERKRLLRLAVDGLDCLLQCENIRPTLVEMLVGNPAMPTLSQVFMVIHTSHRAIASRKVLAFAWKGLVEGLKAKTANSHMSRLSWLLQVEDSFILIAALRVVLTLARIPETRNKCSIVEPRIKDLARKQDPLVRSLAVEILLVLYSATNESQHNICTTYVRANLTSNLDHLSHGVHGLVGTGGHRVDHRQELLCQLFGLDATELSDQQKSLVRELKKVVEKGNVRERTTATMTLLKLCESTVIRGQLREIKLADVFVNQLRRKNSALLAAYALANCLKHSDMGPSIKGNKDLAKHIVEMIKLDYFDDAVGQVEGFQIFGDIMQHADLRAKIDKYNTIDVLNKKLEKGNPKEIRTSLICLDILQSHRGGTWTRRLVAKSLRWLRSQEWKTQKAGVTILFALAQTEGGVDAILPYIQQIVEMLLPPYATSISPSWMMGPASALCILAQNRKLRNHTRNTTEYGRLKHLYLSGVLVDRTDTSPWRVNTPNRADVMMTLYKMIRTVDDGLSECIMSTGDVKLPHVQHWDRLVKSLHDWPASKITGLSALLGVSVLAILAALMFAPAYLSVWVYGFFKCRLLSRHRRSNTLSDPRGNQGAIQGEIGLGSYQPGSPYHSNGALNEYDESSHGIETAHTCRRREGRPIRAPEPTHTQQLRRLTQNLAAASSREMFHADTLF